MKLLVKDEGKVGTLVYLVDSKGRLLNTEPLCLIYSAYFPAFFNWLQQKFREDRRLTNVLPQMRNSEGGKGFAFQQQRRNFLRSRSLKFR